MFYLKMSSSHPPFCLLQSPAISCTHRPALLLGLSVVADQLTPLYAHRRPFVSFFLDVDVTIKEVVLVNCY